MLTGRATRLAVLLLLLVVTAAAPSRVLSQTTASTIKGVIVDKDGNALPGVTVTVENPTLAVTGLGAVTNAQGEYRITPVPPGRGYILRANLPSFQKIEFRDIEVPTGRTLVQNITLRPALKEIVRVEGKSDVVNTESAKISTTITSEFISGLPVLGRDYQDVLTLAPGVTDVNNTGNPNIHGARDTDVVTLVDGVSTTDPFTGQFGQQLNVESIEEIEVITSGATAEYGRAQGGFVNIITKSGGNEFKGTFNYYMRSEKLDGDGAGIDSADLRGGLGETNGFRDLKFTDIYPFLSLSGAFIKDHLWYYFAPEYNQIEEPVNAGTQAFVAKTTSLRVDGKTTWQVAPNNKMAFSIIYDDTSVYDLGVNSNVLRESGYTDTRGGPTLTLQDTAIVSPTLSLESTLSRFDQTFTRRPTIDPDTNGNSILGVDNDRGLGGNRNGFLELRERDPGEDFDGDGKYDVFEDFTGAHTLVNCTPDKNGVIPGNCNDRDRDGRLTQPNGCEGKDREDINCNGSLDSETDTDGDMKSTPSPAEDHGIPCTNANTDLCRDGYLLDPTDPTHTQSTRGNGKFDTEDLNRNGELDTVPGAGDTPFPDWVDRNHDDIPQIGEFRSPLAPDRQYNLSLNSNRIEGPYFRDRDDSRTRDTLKEDLSYYVDDLLGSHDLKMGVIVEKEGYQAAINQRPFFQVSRGAVDPATGNTGGTVDAFLPTLETVHNQANSDNLALFFQDTYKPLPNVTIGLGIRFDREAVHSHGFSFFDPAQQRRDFEALVNLTGVDAGDANSDGIETHGLEGDPLYSTSSPRVTQLAQQLLLAAPSRFTRHNFQSSIDSQKLRDQFALAIGHDPTPEELDALLKSAGFPRQPEDFTITNNNLAPRMSISWDPWADGKSRASAGWSRFYDKLFLATVIGEEGPDFLEPYYAYDVDGVDTTGIPNNKVGSLISRAPPSANQVDRGMKTPYTDEVTLGFQREIAPEVSVSFNYIRRKFRDQLQDIDVNHTVRKREGRLTCDTTPDGYCDTFGLTARNTGNGGSEGGGKADTRLSDTYPDLFINNFNFNQIFRIGNFNVQDYVGYELQLVRRLSRKWQMTTSYSFSKSTGQAESFNSESGDDPALTELRSGFLDFDQRHVAQFHATTYLPGDWQVGGGITWSSGLPFSFINRFRSADNVDFPQTRRLFGSRNLVTGTFDSEARNNHRNHSVYDLNARAEKKFVIGKISAGAFFEIFDILNTDDLRVNEIDNSFRFLQADEQRRFGRRFQFGISMNF